MSKWSKKRHLKFIKTQWDSWVTLFNFQLNYRREREISVACFLRILQRSSPIDDSTIQYLYGHTPKYVPSSISGSLGRALRDAIAELMETRGGEERQGEEAIQDTEDESIREAAGTLPSGLDAVVTKDKVIRVFYEPTNTQKETEENALKIKILKYWKKHCYKHKIDHIILEFSRIYPCGSYQK